MQSRRKRGRPPGAKNKSPREDVIFLPRPVRRPRLYNLKQAAAELNISHDYLTRLEHKIFQPIARHPKLSIYTDDQIDIIAFILCERLTPDEGWQILCGIEDNKLMDLICRSKPKC